MARFCCRACSSEGIFGYSGKQECPKCGSGNVHLALSFDELMTMNKRLSLALKRPETKPNNPDFEAPYTTFTRRLRRKT